MSDLHKSKAEELVEETKMKTTPRFQEDDDEEKRSTEDQDELDHLRRLIKDGNVEGEDAERSQSGGASDSEEDMFTSRTLQEAKKISGGDFSQFDSDPYEEGKEEEDQREEGRDRPKQTKKKLLRKRTFDTKKPRELENSRIIRHFTQKDLRLKIVELFQKNVPQRKIAKTLDVPTSTVHNIIKRYRETGEISVRKGQGRKSLLDTGELQALTQYCVEKKPLTVAEITAWAQKNFKKSLSVNTVRRALEKCKLNVYYARK